MTQLELFAPVRAAKVKVAPAQRHSATSVAAAASIVEHLNRLEQQVFDAIAGSEGLTDQEGVAMTGLSENCYRPRRVRLVELGRLVDSGVKRKTISGRWAVVWKTK